MIYEIKYTVEPLSWYCDHDTHHLSIIEVPFGRIFITDAPEFTYLEACEYCKAHNLRMLSRQEIIQLLITMKYLGTGSNIVINDSVFGLDGDSADNVSGSIRETLSCWAENTVENVKTGKFVFDIIFDMTTANSCLFYNISSEKEYSLKKYILCTDGVQQMI